MKSNHVWVVVFDWRSGLTFLLHGAKKKKRKRGEKKEDRVRALAYRTCSGTDRYSPAAAKMYRIASWRSRMQIFRRKCFLRVCAKKSVELYSDWVGTRRMCNSNYAIEYW